MPRYESPTLSNADLWSAYFRDEWARLLRHGDPASPPASIVDDAAAQVAAWFTIAAAGPLAWMYAASARPHAAS